MSASLRLSVQPKPEPIPPVVDDDDDDDDLSKPGSGDGNIDPDDDEGFGDDDDDDDEDTLWTKPARVVQLLHCGDLRVVSRLPAACLIRILRQPDHRLLISRSNLRAAQSG